MSKKGLSFDAKRTRLLEIFHEKKDVFLLKDLEKIAPKAKQIPMQSVKEVLTSLVNDDMVDTDKIGTSIYFWAFPSKCYTSKLNKVKEQEKVLEELKTKIEVLQKEIEVYTCNVTDDDSDTKQRIEIQEELLNLTSQCDKMQAEIERRKDCDPNSLQQMQTECATARDAVERWTDNVFAVKSWCKKKFQMENSEINKALNIPPDFDYFEY